MSWVGRFLLGTPSQTIKGKQNFRFQSNANYIAGSCVLNRTARCLESLQTQYL